ncbi:MAG: hypothetical protein Q9218_001102 [Villophora microphyllina]
MPSAVLANDPGPANDDLDDLLNYKVNIDDVFRDVDVSMNADSEDKVAKSKSKGDSPGLGIDEEIKQKRPRQPVAKLDKERLLSQAGVPKLRRLAKERFKFKGKGHEYSDLARLLNIYQLWLDDLYPRAKFADGLAMIEKLGHRKDIQVMRREWINEGKPRDKYLDPPGEAEGLQRTDEGSREMETDGNQPKISTNMGIEVSSAASDSNGRDLYSASPRQKRDKGTQQLPSDTAETLFLPTDDHPPEDDLDALLAEDDFIINKYTLTSNAQPEEKTKEPSKGDNFDDEMEAIAETDDW